MWRPARGSCREMAVAAFGDPTGCSPSTQPILYDPARLELLEEGWFFFSETPEVIYSRTFNGSFPAFASSATFRTGQTGEAFLLVNVHFDWSSWENPPPVRGADGGAGGRNPCRRATGDPCGGSERASRGADDWRSSKDPGCLPRCTGRDRSFRPRARSLRGDRPYRHVGRLHPGRRSDGSGARRQAAAWAADHWPVVLDILPPRADRDRLSAGSPLIVGRATEHYKNIMADSICLKSLRFSPTAARYDASCASLGHVPARQPRRQGPRLHRRLGASATPTRRTGAASAC